MAQLVVKAIPSLQSPPLTPPGGQVNKQGPLPSKLLLSPDASPLAPLVSLKHISAESFIRYIRRCEIGKLREEQGVFLITIAEYQKALQTFEQPSFSRLRGYFEDKLRYDYDSTTEVLRICMPGHIHELFCGIVSKALADYLRRISDGGGGAVKAFSSNIVGCNSADITYRSKQDADYEQDFDGYDDSFTSNTTDTPPSVSPRHIIPTRKSRRLLSRVAQQKHGSSAAAEASDTYVSTSPGTASAYSDAFTIIKKWSPDNSWQHEDDTRPTVIVEVAKTQSMESLTSKAINLIEQCSAKVVLGFHLGLSARDHLATAASVTKWTAKADDQGAIKSTSISKDFLSPENVPVTEGSIKVHLDDFASDRVLNDKDETDFTAILEVPPLLLELRHLGEALVKIKEQETLRTKNRAQASPSAQGKVPLTSNRAAIRKRRRDAEEESAANVGADKAPEKRGRRIGDGRHSPEALAL